MNLPEISIRRPVTVLMVTLIVMLFGIVSLTKLPVELYANTSFGEISIVINVRGGMPPPEVESQVTRIVEEGVATVGNLSQLMSISKEGVSTVVVSFQQGTDMDFAALEIREKFAKVKDKLPKDIEKPVIAQFQQNDVPVLIVSAISPVRSTEEIRKLIDRTMKESLKRVPGVANVEVVGGRERKIIIDADQVRLAAFGVSLDEVTSVVGANNLNLLSGELKKEKDTSLVRVIGELEEVENFKNIPLRTSDQGTIVRVRDVASVKDAYMEPGEYSRLNVRPVVTIYVQKESSKNTITVAEKAMQTIEEGKNRLPKDIRLIVTSDQSQFIKNAVANLTKSLLEGIVLIILVFFLFLYKLNRWQLAAIVSLILITLFFSHGGPLLKIIFAVLVSFIIIRKKYRPIIIVTMPIPVSVVGTFIFMRSAGLSINVMTLFGLALGVGMLIDNSIVVFENILKKVEHGHDMFTASCEGANEMFLTLVASTATNVIVFLPLLFMGAELQKLYSGMAATIVVSLMISMVCAVTLVPMMSALNAFSIKSAIPESEKGGAGFSNFAHLERRLLFKSIRYRFIVWSTSIAIFLASLFVASKLGSEYLGSTEQNKFTTFIELPSGARVDASDKIVRRVEKLLQKIPEVANISSRVENWSSKIYVELNKSTERSRSVGEVIDMLRPETDKLKPAFIYYSQEESVGTKEITIEIFGFSYEKLRELAIATTNRLQQIKGLSDIKIRMREGRPEMQILPEKIKAASYDLNNQQLANQVHGQMRGLRATTFHTDATEIETISRLDEKYRKTFKDLHKLIMTNKENDPMYLDQAANFKFGLGPSEIWRKDRSRVVQVSASIGKVPLSKIADQINEQMKTVPFPEEYYYRIAGDYPTMIKANKQLKAMIIFVLVLVYLVLASLFESFFQPFIIMKSVPLALVGAVIALWFGPKTIGVGAMLGMMMLGGIVVNHSIMLIDRINHYLALGRSTIRSSIMANQDRLRPILMTMSMTVLGLLPMAIDHSEGANLWSPLALTVIGGVVSSTILTLMVTPAFYVISSDIGKLVKNKFRKQTI